MANLKLFLNDFKDKLTVYPKYSRINEVIVSKQIPKVDVDSLLWQNDKKVKKTEMVNKSISVIEFILENISDFDLNDFEVEIEISGKISNLKEKSLTENINLKVLKNRLIYKSDDNDTLKSSDNRFFQIEFKAPAIDQTLIINWKSKIKEFSDSGTLEILVKPEIIDKKIEVLDYLKSKEQNYIQDYYEKVEIEGYQKEGCLKQ